MNTVNGQMLSSQPQGDGNVHVHCVIYMYALLYAYNGKYLHYFRHPYSDPVDVFGEFDSNTGGRRGHCGFQQRLHCNRTKLTTFVDNYRISRKHIYYTIRCIHQQYWNV